MEDIESHYPLRVNRYELLEDRGGPGQWRGGLGSVRDMTFLSDGRASLEGEGNKYAPWELFGGKPGTPGSVVVLPANGGDPVDLPSKFPSHKFRAGETLRTTSPCGGGYVDPLFRNPQAVLDDVLDELVSPQCAHDQYGVVLAADGSSVDLPATEALRATLRGSRDASE
jgi:N-methylhydantoinase B